MKIVEVWPKGYAHESGLKRLTVDDDANPWTAVRAAFGPWATVAGIRPARAAPAEVFSLEYIREMSKNDNS
jgi:hypothetical protein